MPERAPPFPATLRLSGGNCGSRTVRQVAQLCRVAGVTDISVTAHTTVNHTGTLEQGFSVTAYSLTAEQLVLALWPALQKDLDLGCGYVAWFDAAGSAQQACTRDFLLRTVSRL